MHRARNIIIFIVIVAAIVAATLYYRLEIKAVKMNDGYVNGNFGGNNYNNGLFCEYNGTVYFANPDDQYCLYSMPAEGGALRKLSTDAVSSINVDEHYIYFVRENSNAVYDFSFLQYNNNVLCRTDLNGERLEVLDDDPCMYATLIGNYIYYLHYDDETATTAYRVRIDGKEKERISTEPIYTCCCMERYLYYSGHTNDHNIHRMDTSTMSSSEILTGNYWMPQITDDAVYYLDLEDNYALKKVPASNFGEEPVILSDEYVQNYNVYGSVIFYQTHEKNGGSKLCRINTDGSDQKVIAEGEYKNINITSTYTYFHDFNDNGLTYYTPTFGDGGFVPFSPGRVAEEE